MKKVLKFFLKIYLKALSKIVLLIYRPTIIAIAGSLNKSFTKNQIENSLVAAGYQVRSSINNFNTEIGLPLAILDLPSGYNNYAEWLPILKQSTKSIFAKNFPKILILELGTSYPGDMEYLLSIIKPKIAVITDITKRYLDSFNSLDVMLNEYRILARSVETSGLLVFNSDNDIVRLNFDSTSGKVIRYGLKEDSDYRALNIKQTGDGQEFEICRQDNTNIKRTKYFGLHHIYSILAAEAIKDYVCQNQKD